MDLGTLLDALQRADLMGTGCFLNDGMEDEYAPEARQIARLLADGSSLHDAIITTFDDQFWVGCLDESGRIDSLHRLLKNFAGHG